ncbi:unnamed protein product, partial [marine sediment metagenome]
MPMFPKKEDDILTLIDRMIAGRIAHPGDFPHLSVVGLTAKRQGYIMTRDAQADAYAAAKLATEDKLAALKSLQKTMKKKLKQSEVDLAGDPEKLRYIGWGPRTEPQPVEAPTAPRNLHSIAEGQGMLWLAWDKPASGGPARNYIIERREQLETGSEFGMWSLAGSALNNEINLKGQPRGVQAEYR